MNIAQYSPRNSFSSSLIIVPSPKTDHICQEQVGRGLCKKTDILLSVKILHEEYFKDTDDWNLLKKSGV